MPRAVVHDAYGRTRAFIVDFCQIHAVYNGRLYSLQQGTGWLNDGIYEPTGALYLDDTMREEEQAKMTGAETMDQENM